MNSYEKFQAILSFDTSKPVPNWEFAYWYDTIMRWYDEGLTKKNPPGFSDEAQFKGGDICGPYDFFSDHFMDDVHDYFNFDERIHIVGLNTSMIPAYERIVYQEDERLIVFRRSDGKTVKTRKDGVSMPHFIDYPVKCEDDFKQIMMRFDTDSPKRFAASVEEYAARYKVRTYPLQLGAGNFAGFFSVIRELMGVEGSLLGFYDNPELLEKILHFFTEFYIDLYTRVVQKTEVDYILIWEDLAFKNGPLISPSIFREFILPCYKQFTAALKKYGVKHFIVDTDGNFESLIPLFLEGGVTGFYPFEVAAGMDMIKIRNEYPELIMIGGIDKRILAEGKTAIDNELRRVEWMIERGGYIPCTDHAVPPEVSFDNYSYFRKQLKGIIDGEN